MNLGRWNATTRRKRLRWIAAGLLALLVVTPSVALGTKYYDSNFGGSPGATGGIFSTANGGIGDLAVNSPGITSDGGAQSGWVYVVDRGNNRVQAFDSSRVFQFAIGRDVVAAGGTGDTNEKQTVVLDGAPAGGTFSLTFGANTTAPIAFDAPASGTGSVQEALQAIASVGVGNVIVTGPPGGPYVVEFVGARASVDQGQMTADGSGLAPAGTVTVATVQDGASFEKCTVAAQCKIGTIAITANTARGNAGTFNVAAGIDIDQATGHIFVSERTTGRRVQEFTADGQFVRAFGWDVTLSGPGNTGGFETCNAAQANDICQASGAAGNAAGQFANNSTAINGVAVAPPSAPNAGRVYVADPGNARVQSFAVPTTANGAVIANPPFGSSTSQFPTSNTWPRDVAADGNGVVYASSFPASGSATSGAGRVERFDTTADSGNGAFASPIPGGADKLLGPSQVNGMEVDASGHLFLGRNPASGAAPGIGVQELDISGNPVDVGDAQRVDIHGVGLGVTANAVGVESATGRLYATTSTSVAGTGTGNRILVLDEDGVNPPPTITTAAPTAVGATTATLNVVVNPNGPTGFPTSYRFQVSKDGIDWTDATTDTLVGATGDGGAPVAITRTVSGLEANTVYRARVRTTRSPAAGVAFSGEEMFVTDTDNVSAETGAAQHVTDVGAYLVGRINPGGSATKYWFEWGDTDYGHKQPAVPAVVGAGGAAKVVGEQLTGLMPLSTYHFRVCATSDFGPTPVCGVDRVFTTKASITSSGARSYEMVTAPDKALRRGGGNGLGGPDYTRFQEGLPAPDGESLLWTIFGGATDVEVDHGFSFATSYEEVRRRTLDGWMSEPVLNIPPLSPASSAVASPLGLSADLKTQVWNYTVPLFVSGSTVSTHVMGVDSGGPRDAGWWPWLDTPWYQGSTSDYFNPLTNVVLDDAGARAILWNSQASRFRDIVPADDTLRPNQLNPPQTDGQALFLSLPPTWRPADLINECSGTGTAATVLPSREGTGFSATDTVGTYECAQGSPTSTRGALLGSAPGLNVTNLGNGTATNAMSKDGRRIFFMSPDPNASGVPTGAGCALLSVGPASVCPPQLFVRQYDDAGNPTVRWISRPASGMPTQEVGLLGGVSFEGASRDGSVVYFRTNGPLTADDPNGGSASLATGSASTASWDLYRYELPADNNADPADGTLTRVSVCPSSATGTGDLAVGSTTVSNVNTATGTFRVGQMISGTAGIPAGTRITAIGSGTLTLSASASATVAGATIRASSDPNTNAANGSGAAVRFLSDDGKRAYFVTAAQIPGADNSARPGDATIPTAFDTQTNATTRNLYLYDADKTGAGRCRFIARIPFSDDNTKSSACASWSAATQGPIHSLEQDTGQLFIGQGVVNVLAPNCVHGTSSGDAVVFETPGRLTADDTDDAIDVYLYNAMRDELTRLTAPPTDGAPYTCVTAPSSSVPVERCNGDLGFSSTFKTKPQREGVGLGGLRRYNIAEDAAGKLKAVYFETRLPLVSQDTNGNRMDVYEWRPDGRLSLISPGNADHSAFYVGNSRDGEDVFFWTEQGLDSVREIDTADGDVYDARVGGGFPPPPAPRELCDLLAGGCQSSGVDRSGDAVSTDSGGKGNAPPETRVTLTLAGMSARSRASAAKRGVLPLVVRASRAGRVSALAKASMGKKVVTVGRASKRLRVAGRVRLALRLSKLARGRLAKGQALRLAVSVRMPGARTRSMTIVLRRAAR